jgi:hypothetical protein
MCCRQRGRRRAQVASNRSQATGRSNRRATMCETARDMRHGGLRLGCDEAQARPPRHPPHHGEPDELPHLNLELPRMAGHGAGQLALGEVGQRRCGRALGSAGSLELPVYLGGDLGLHGGVAGQGAERGSESAGGQQRSLGPGGQLDGRGQQDRQGQARRADPPAGPRPVPRRGRGRRRRPVAGCRCLPGAGAGGLAHVSSPGRCRRGAAQGQRGGRGLAAFFLRADREATDGCQHGLLRADRRCELLLRLEHLLVQAAHVGQDVGGEVDPGLPGGAVRLS